MKNFWLDRKRTLTTGQSGVSLMTRSGHIIVMDDESHSISPWSNAYEGFDFDAPPEKQEPVPWPKIYGWKTPDKHTIKADDKFITLRSSYGVSLQMKDEEPKCEKRWKRIEIHSNMGTSLIMKEETNTQKEEYGRVDRHQEKTC